jgi:NAD(P)H-dependent FMN reductase
MTVISVIVGSTREGRFSDKPAKWILQHLKKREGVDAGLLDLRDFPMPFFDQPVTPAAPGRPSYKNEVVQRWTAAIAQSDGFVFVTPEYNFGPPAVLKKALSRCRRSVAVNVVGNRRHAVADAAAQVRNEPARSSLKCGRRTDDVDG